MAALPTNHRFRERNLVPPAAGQRLEARNRPVPDPSRGLGVPPVFSWIGRATESHASVSDMPLVTSLVLGALKAGGTALARTLDPAEQMRRQFDVAAEQADRELGQVAYAVVTALVAKATCAHPDAADVQAIMTSIASAPGGPARVYRHLGEARKSASKKRQQLLAAVLYGLPLTDMPPDDRDRVDMLVERLMTEDVALLGAIAKHEGPLGDDGEPTPSYALKHGDLYLVSASDLRRSDLQRDGLDRAPALSTPAFSSLQAHGCVSMPGSLSEDVTLEGISALANAIAISPLGRLLLKALHDVHVDIGDST